MFHSVTSFNMYPESSSSRNSSSVSLYPVTSSFLDLSSSLNQPKVSRSKKMLSSFEDKHRLTLNVLKRKTSRSRVYCNENAGSESGVASPCRDCNCDGISAAMSSTTTLESVCDLTTPNSSRTSSDHLIGPVYDDSPKITPAYLRYLRAETKRSEEHLFGSVASRGTDISREERWEARMSELRRREEADGETVEAEGESQNSYERKRWFRTLVPQSHK
jgi:hypothetical protein